MKKLFSVCVIASACAAVTAPVVADEANLLEKAVETVQQAEMTQALSQEQIKTIQEKLVAEGYNLEVDGNLSQELSAVLREFQKANDLPVTGEANSETMAKLNITQSN